MVSYKECAGARPAPASRFKRRAAHTHSTGVLHTLSGRLEAERAARARGAQGARGAHELARARVRFSFAVCMC